MDIKILLEAVDTALSVIKTVAETPGVSALPYASTVSAAIGAIRVGIDAGQNVAPYVEALKNTFTDGLPSQEDLDALDAKIAELRAKVQAPLPAREDGEEE